MSLSATNVKANSGKFSAPDAIFDRKDLKLGPFEKLVFLYLSRRANSEKKCWPGQHRIAEDCGISRATVMRSLPKLLKSGVVKAKRTRAGYRYLIIPWQQWPGNKPQEEPASSKSSEPPKKLPTATQEVAHSNIPKLLPAAQRLHREGSTKKDPPTPHKQLTETEREARGRTDRLVSELGGRGGTFLKTGEIIEQFRERGLREIHLTAALREMERTRKKEGVRSVPVLLGEKILPRYIEQQAEEDAEHQRKLEREQAYQESWERAKRDRDNCEEKNGAVDIEAMIAEFKTTGLAPALTPKDPPSKFQPAIAVNG